MSKPPSWLPVSTAALVDVMRIVAEAGGGSPLPEFASTHPDPKNRAKLIQAYIGDFSGTCTLGLLGLGPSTRR